MNFELEFFIRDLFKDLRKTKDANDTKNAEIIERIKTLKHEVKNKK